MLWHRLRGHAIESYRVMTPGAPWRWQCSCGHVWGGPPHRA